MKYNQEKLLTAQWYTNIHYTENGTGTIASGENCLQAHYQLTQQPAIPCLGWSKWKDLREVVRAEERGLLPPLSM